MLHRKTVFILYLASAAWGCSSSDAHSPTAGNGGSIGSAGASGAGASGAGANGAGANGAGAGGAGAGGVSNEAGLGGSLAAAAGESDANAGNNEAGGAAPQGTACTPPSDVFSPIARLSNTGCMDAANPTQPTAKAIAYEVNSPLWSDLADKTRAFVLPTGAKIHVRDCKLKPSDCPFGAADEGRWDFPVGTVMIKNFSFDAKVLETRLFMHLDALDWVGYSYQWNEAQTDATIVSADGADVTFDTGMRSVNWHYPSQKDCLNCHNSAGGSTLGPETAQLNRLVHGSNQIDVIAKLGLFETPPAMPYKAALVAPYVSRSGSPPATATVEQKARSYLHANCGFCHRPGGNYSNFDYRYDTAFKDMNLCADAKKGAIANAPGKTRLLVPGTAMDSVTWLRMNEPDPMKGRMPQIASFVVDTPGTAAVGAWINAMTSDACPPTE